MHVYQETGRIVAIKKFKDIEGMNVMNSVYIHIH